MRITFGRLFSILACLTFISIATQAQIVFDRPKTEPPLDNPYTMNVTREEVIKGISEILKTCNIQMDAEKTKLQEGRFYTQFVVFTKGVNVRTDLEHVSTPSAIEARNWLRGRAAIEINVLPLDEKRSQLRIIAHIQGQVAELTGSRWIDTQSNGVMEDEVLRAIAGKILGIDLALKKGTPRRLLGCEF